MKTKATASLLGATVAVLLGGYAFHAYGQDEEVKAKVVAKDPAISKAAFLEVYKVLMHPRCMNCHPAGNAPLQGDDSHPHAMNVTAGPEGKGIYALKCANCHQHANLPGHNMPPGNPNWHLPPRDTPMVFEGKSPSELAALLKDPKTNGGKDHDQLMHHIAEDKLVLWGWDPGEGRTLPPLTHEEFTKQFRLWLDHGAEVPDE